MSQQQQQKTNTHLPLPQRLYHHQWLTRKTAYQQIYHLLKEQQTEYASLSQPIFIGGHQYTPQKLIPLMTDLSDEKHTTVLLKGLSCIELILKRKVNKRGKSEFGKHFLKLVNEGLQKFPLLVQLRNVVLQKFSEILDLIDIQPRILKDKLSLPHEKSIFFALQIISHLDLKVLAQDVRNLSNRHPKQQVRQLAIEILQELQYKQIQEEYNNAQNAYDQNVNYNQNIQLSNQNVDSMSKCIRVQHNKKNPTTITTMKKKDKLVQEVSNDKINNVNKKRNYLLDQMPHFKKLSSKQQQVYSSELLQNIDLILDYPLPTTLDLAHYVRLMIEDNNFITSMNGIKILTNWLTNQTTMNQIPNSYPLLFFFDKFKMHSTHQINGILFDLADALVSAGRVIDLVQAAADGLASAKANVKYGAGMICIRIVSIMNANQDLFYQNIQGQKQFPQHIQIPTAKHKNIEKYLHKCCDLMIKDKDKTLKGIAESIRIQMGYTFQTQSLASKNKNKPNRMKNMMNNSVNTRSNQHINSSIPTDQPVNSKQTLQTSGSMTISISNNNKHQKNLTNKNMESKKSEKIQNNSKSITVNHSTKKPEQLMKKIVKLASQPSLYTEKQLTQVLTMFTNEVSSGLSQGKYSLFYLTEVLQSLLRNYVPHQENAELISQFLVKNIKAISCQKSKFINAQNQQHLSILLKMSLCDIVLGKQVQGILNSLSRNYPMNFLIIVLNSVQGKVRKKNRQNLIQWLNSEVSVDLLNEQYYELLRKVNSGQILNDNYAKKQQIQKQQILRQRQQVSQQEQTNVGLNFHNIRDSQQPMFNNFKQQNCVRQCYSKHQQNAYEEIQQRKQTVKPMNKFKESLKRYTRQIQADEIDQKQDDYNIDTQPHSNNYQQQLQNSIRNFPSYQQLKSKPYIKTQAKLKSKEEHTKEKNVNQKYQSCITERQSQYSQLSQMQCQISRIAPLQEEESYDHNYGLPTMPTSNKKQQYDEKWEYFLAKHQNQLNNPQQAQKLQYPNDGGLLHRQQQNDQSNNENDLHNPKIQQVIKWLDSYNNQPNETETYDFDKKAKQIFKYIPHAQQQKTIHQQQQDAYQQQQENAKESSCSLSDKKHEQDDFQYQILNIQKMNYMLNCTANPYPHLRTLILTPFRTHPRKHHFLQQLTHYFSHKQLKTPQPYNAILLITILLFSDIKTDKSLISPLQHLYQYLASLNTTNFFVKTLLSLMHSVIEQTAESCRSFLITILSKSMSRLLPFAQEPLQMLRDIQQFYQIGEMVYFDMYTAQYGQIRSAIEGVSLEEAIKKAFQVQGHNLIVIVEGWLQTDFKEKVKECVDKLRDALGDMA